jgi:hypothetical protein
MYSRNMVFGRKVLTALGLAVIGLAGSLSAATLYNGAGTPQALIVGTPPSPTGQVFNTSSSSFNLHTGGQALFIFDAKRYDLGMECRTGHHGSNRVHR